MRVELREIIPVRRGITIIELLVVFAVTAVLVALLLSALQTARESARRIECSHHMRQVSLAVANYETLHLAYPEGIRFKMKILPQLGESAVFQLVTDGDFDSIKKARILTYQCPSDGVGGRVHGANIAGCFGTGVLDYGFNGFFNWPHAYSPQWPTGWLRHSDIQNGHSNVVMLSEILIGVGDPDLILRTNYETPSDYGLGELEVLASFCDKIPEPPSLFGYSGVSNVRGTDWFDSSFGHGLYNHALGPNRPSCMNHQHLATGVFSAASNHPQGVNVGFADGRVVFTSNAVDLKFWRAIGSRVDKNVTY